MSNRAETGATVRRQFRQFLAAPLTLLLALIGAAHAQSLSAKDISLAGEWRVESQPGWMDWIITDTDGRLAAVGHGDFTDNSGKKRTSNYRCTGSKDEKLKLDCTYESGTGERKSTMIFTITDQNTLSRDGMPFPVIMLRK